MAVKQALLWREKDGRLTSVERYRRLPRRSQWQKKVADAIGNNSRLPGISQTHDEIGAQDRRDTTAVNEARMDMAMSNVESSRKIKIDDEAEKTSQAHQLVKQSRSRDGPGIATSQRAAGSAEKTIAAKIHNGLRSVRVEV